MWNLIKKLFTKHTYQAPVPPIELPPVAATLPPNNGIINDFKFADISHYEKCDFSKYNCKILITKATEGTGLVDSTFKNVQAQCKLRAIPFGAYHFFRCNLPALDQAKFYLETVGTFILNPILDIETLDGVSHEECKKQIKIWLSYVELVTGKVPVIYSGHSFLVELNLDASFAKYPLWLARYTTIKPVAPAPWKEWTAWQYSDKDIFNGIGACDSNVYNGKFNGLGLK